MTTERYMLDTNATIWYATVPDKLGKNIRELVDYNLGFVSIISMQEIGILITLNKIKIQGIKNIKDIVKFIQLKGLDIL